MEPELFDIHCHLNLPEFQDDWEFVLNQAQEKNCWLINVGADFRSSKLAVEQANSKPLGIWATVGFHPTDSEDFSKENWDEIRNLAKNSKVVAIGECGLEYYERGISKLSAKQKEQQKELFRRHIELSLELKKPLMIHCRPSQGSMEAYEEALEILKEYQDVRGNFHFFAGSWDIAERCLEIGFTMSFTGVITFSNNYDSIVRQLPENMILAETDAPFVAPVPFRGKRCEPLHVKEVALRMAELRGVSYEEMSRILIANARRVFNI